MIDLILAKRIAVTFRRRRLLWSDAVAVLDATPTGDGLLDDVLQLIATADAGSCSSWVKRTARGAAVAYWDRLVEKALLRPDHISFDAPWEGVHAETLAAITERVWFAIAEPGRADVRDVALTTLVLHTQSLFDVLYRLQGSPAEVARKYMAYRRDKRLAGDALDSYKRSLTSHAGLAEADRKWAETAADGIEHLADIVDDRPTGGG